MALSNLVTIWHIFLRFGVLCQEKSGNSDCNEFLVKVTEKKLQSTKSHPQFLLLFLCTSQLLSCVVFFVQKNVSHVFFAEKNVRDVFSLSSYNIMYICIMCRWVCLYECNIHVILIFEIEH
jgi:hypothetical protein